jgi:Cd2+/Zn2+-exporting ATPase
VARERMSCRIDGLDCIDCAKKLETSLSEMEGVEEAKVSYTLGTLTLEMDPERVSREDVDRHLGRFGYRAVEEDLASLSDVIDWREPKVLATILSGVLLGAGIVVQLSSFDPLLYRALFLAGIVVGGTQIVRKGVAALMDRYLDINFLMTIAIVGAVVIDEWAEANSIVFLFSLAELLESLSVARTRRSITSLVELAPKRAHLVHDGEERDSDVEQLKVDDVIVVRPGERVPADGTVVAGSSELDESTITGESRSVNKEEGAKVFAGTLNLTGSLEVRVDKLHEDTVLVRIVHMVEEAEGLKAPTEQFIDRFARYYTPTVVLSAFLIATLPYLLFNEDLEEWFYRSLVLLVISCPCALVLSTPISVFSAIAGGARKGVLFKGGLFLERMGQARAIAFDKTGTITRGRPRVEEVIPLGGHDSTEVLRMAASAENRSEHHLARAVMEAARHEDVRWKRPDDFVSHPGKGVIASVDGKRVFSGSPHFFEEQGIDISDHRNLLEEKASEGKTPILVGTEDGIVGLLTLRDLPRPEAKAVISRLKGLGMEKIVMLTGDDEKVARLIANDLGFDEYHARLLPEEKVEVIDSLSKTHEGLIMVGDGVNDAPALARADVGVAMGVAGTDIALESADVALMGDDLHSLVHGIEIGRKAARIIRINVLAALAIKMTFFTLAFPGLVTLWMAILIGDLGTSLGVILNSMRLIKG